MRKIFMIEKIIPANGKSTPDIDTGVVIKETLPFISKIFGENIEGGKVLMSLRHKEDSINFFENIDLSVIHRDNREKQSIEYRSGNYVFTLENLTTADITVRIYLEGVYSL